MRAAEQQEKETDCLMIKDEQDIFS
jgi:hypothetical protein